MRNMAHSAHVLTGLVAGLVATTLVTARAAAGDPPEKPAAAATTAAPAPAKPKPPTKKQRDGARKAYAEGEKAYNSGKYDAAYEAFQKANEFIHSPQADYWIAKSLDAQNKTEEAIAAYETFVNEPSATSASDQKMDDAKARLEALKASLVAEVAVETDPMLATVTVDGETQQGEGPMTLKLTPGKHHITVSASGYTPKEVDIDVKGGEHLKQSISLTKEAPPPPVAPPPPPPAPAAPPPPAPPPEEHSMVPAYVTLGIAGAAGIVGTIFGVKALGSKSDFDKNPTTQSADDTERSALIADMAFGVAITLGVTGVVLLTSDDEPPPPAAAHVRPAARPRLAILPYAGPKSGGASAKLTF